MVPSGQVTGGGGGGGGGVGQTEPAGTVVPSAQVIGAGGGVRDAHAERATVPAAAVARMSASLMFVSWFNNDGWPTQSVRERSFRGNAPAAEPDTLFRQAIADVRESRDYLAPGNPGAVGEWAGGAQL